MRRRLRSFDLFVFGVMGSMVGVFDKKRCFMSLIFYFMRLNTLGEIHRLYAKRGSVLIISFYQHRKRQSLKSFSPKSIRAKVYESSLLMQILGETGVIEDGVVILAQRSLVSLL